MLLSPMHDVYGGRGQIWRVAWSGVVVNTGQIGRDAGQMWGKKAIDNDFTRLTKNIRGSNIKLPSVLLVFLF